MKSGVQVPMLDLSRQYASIRDDILAAVERVCGSQRYILGDEVSALEHEFASLSGTAEAVACASGTDALWLALIAAGIKNGDAVITTPFSFFASASAIVRAGARPIFVDIEPDTLNLDPVALEKSLREAPLAARHGLLPVHLYGQCADMDALSRLAAEFNLLVIEDAAQAAGAAWNGRPAGSMGLAAAFSFYPTKNLSAFGDAGALTTSDHDLAEHARSLRNHGAKQRYYHDEIGWNSRMDAIQAAVLRVKLPYLARWNEARRERARIYDRLFAQAGLASQKPAGSGAPIVLTPQHAKTGRVGDPVQLTPQHAKTGRVGDPVQLTPQHAKTGRVGDPVQLLETRPQAFHIFHQYVIRAQKRDQLRAFLQEHGIGSEVYYPVPLHLQKCFAYLGYAAGDLPRAERAAQDVLALPMFAELEEDEQRHVVETVAEFYS